MKLNVSFEEYDISGDVLRPLFSYTLSRAYSSIYYHLVVSIELCVEFQYYLTHFFK